MKRILILAISALFLCIEGCKSNDPFTGDCFIPDVGVNLTINMDLPEYYNLQVLKRNESPADRQGYGKKHWS